MDCLIGDSSPYLLYEELSKKPLNYNDIIKEEFRLTNLYLHALKNGAGILRVPTGFCSKGYLEQSDSYSRMESIINVCISTAKNAMKQVNANILLAGCIGNIHEADKKPETDIIKELSECIVYISDFGVDTIVIEGIEDWEMFEMTVGMCRKLTGCPIAPFFKTANINIALIHEYSKLCDEFSIELMGFEICGLNGLEALHRLDIISESPLGIILSADKDFEHSPVEEYVNPISQIKPTVLLGGNGILRKNWYDLAKAVKLVTQS